MKRYIQYGLAALLIAVALGFAFRGELFFLVITPAADFADFQAPAMPDYAMPESWAALPDRQDGADIIPERAEFSDNQKLAAADVFFVHPTTHLTRDGWNAAMDNDALNLRTDLGSMRYQASIFNGCCRVYAPRYRQAALAAFISSKENGLPALDLAYADVKAAFEYYLAHYNQGRPFILAGHSQGTGHAARLLAEEIEGKPHHGRMIAAYLVGYPARLSADGKPFAKTDMCRGAADTGCVVSWNTALEGADTGKFRSRVDLSAGLPEVQRLARGEQICINPLNWSGSGKASAEAHSGAIAFIPDRDKPVGPLLTHLISARCEGGYLMISNPGKGFQKLVFPPGNYHFYDYNLFYMNLRENAAARTDAWLQHSQATVN